MHRASSGPVRVLALAGTSTISPRSGSIWTRTASLSEHRCYRLGRCRRTGARGCGRRAGMGTVQPTHRTRTLVRTEDATAVMARLRKAQLGQQVAAGTGTPKAQRLKARLLALATISTRAFWDWRGPSVRRYSEAFCGSTGASISLS